jgi:hypothetical protein
MPTQPAGSKEYDVYVLMEQRSRWSWLFWWLKPVYEIKVGTAFDSAEKAALAAQIRANASPGRAIGIAADALVCCQPVDDLVS